MKIKYILTMILGLSLLCVSCYDDDNATPSGDYSPIRYTFPQGTAPHDKYFKEVYDQYGICVIYKDFTLDDLNKTWVASLAGKWIGHPVAEERVPQYVDLLKEFLFPYMNNKEIISKCMPLYLYLADDLSLPLFPGFYMGLGSKLDGMDFWAIGLLDTLPIVNNNPAGDAIKSIYVALLEKAVINNLIPEPEGFRNGVDYSKPVQPVDYYELCDPEDPYYNDPDYFATRGFVGNLKPSYAGYMGWFQWTGSYWDGDLNKILSTPGGDFRMFALAAIRYTKEEFKQLCPPEKFPLLNKRYDMTVEQFRKYGFDLQACVGKWKELPPRSAY